MSGAALLGVMLGTCEKANELARICREGSVFEATMINTKPDRVKGDNVLVTIRQSSQNKGLIPRFQAFRSAFGRRVTRKLSGRSGDAPR